VTQDLEDDISFNFLQIPVNSCRFLWIPAVSCKFQRDICIPLPFHEKNHFPKTSENKKKFWRPRKALLIRSTQQAPLPKQAETLTKEKDQD